MNVPEPQRSTSTGDEPTEPVGAATGATSAQDLLADWGERGCDTSFVPSHSPGTIRCTTCGHIWEPSPEQVLAERRLEGASDPDDMALVVALECPSCSTRGALELGYGPTASEVDADVVLALAPPPKR